jgi:hypothetical protein
MGRDLSTTDAAFGFQPYGELLRATWYAVETNPTVGLNIGDLVETDGTSFATPLRGNLLGCVHEETGAAGSILGAVIALEDHNGAVAQKIAASATGNSVISGYALVADHPQQEFIAQEDGDTSSIQAADIGLNVDAIGNGSNSNTGISTMEIDSNTVSTTNTLALKIIGVHPDDSISAAAAAGNYCRFIVMLNSAHRASNIAGA